MSELHVHTITVSDPDHLGLELNTLRDLHAPCSVVSVSHDVEQQEGGERWTVLVVLEIGDERAMDQAAEAVEARE
ncbi:MAG: hypothetical protein H0V81_15540 [Solirubrobacterales bacterium]|nr:hypothetical protein [Solirubrobacterales bacterium]